MNQIKKASAVLLLLALLVTLAPAGRAEAVYSTSPTSSVWNTYKPSLHYYYQQLTDREKMAFSSMYDAIALGKPELWQIGAFDLSYNERSRVQYAVKYDCPELMFADYQFSDFFESEEEITKQTAILKEYRPKVIKVLKSIQKQSNYKGGSFNHEIAVDRWMVKNCRYLLDDKTYNGSRVPYKGRRAAYSVFVNKVAVCEGYARGMQFAMRYFGIPCLYVYGYADFTAHAWNMVQIGGAWYQYDGTWNDFGNTKTFTDFYPFFNLTDTAMGRSHTISKEANTLYGFKFPTCKTNKWEYYKQKGQYVGSNWKSKIRSLISKAQNNKAAALGVRFSDSTHYYNAYYAIKFGNYRVKYFKYFWHIDDALVLYFTKK